MKHTLLFILLLLLISGTLIAQQLSFSPNPVYLTTYVRPDAMGGEYIGEATLTNEGVLPVSLRWERFFNNVPEAWEVQVCDRQLCYEEPVYTNMATALGLNMPLYLNPGESAKLEIRLKTKGRAGDGSVTLDITEAFGSDEVVLASNTFYLSTPDLGGASQSVAFPNPAGNYFEVTGTGEATRVVLYNVIGKPVREFQVMPGAQYQLGGLPNGLYLASLMDQNGKILRTFRIAKRVVQP